MDRAKFLKIITAGTAGLFVGIETAETEVEAAPEPLHVARPLTNITARWLPIRESGKIIAYIDPADAPFNGYRMIQPERIKWVK